MTFREWLLTDESVIPLLMILAGAASLGFESLLRAFVGPPSPGQALPPRLATIAQRLEQRRKLSWLLTFVGTLWLSVGFVAGVA